MGELMGEGPLGPACPAPQSLPPEASGNGITMPWHEGKGKPPALAFTCQALSAALSGWSNPSAGPWPSPFRICCLQGQAAVHTSPHLATSPTGRNPDTNLEALEEFKKLVQLKGLSEGNIFMPLQMVGSSQPPPLAAWAQWQRWRERHWRLRHHPQSKQSRPRSPRSSTHPGLLVFCPE
ncbi:hypothetical protein P7K49_001988 [Saguinus oedipus]|uniref:Uncharacterized protein n=1 Tax=Saguinus oedipus TaxID=9490 RepID=A0ABQ9WG35_SAGOE|nr:hypothetical protein P7K49_001988 [Saguinus oedipus]